MKIKLSITQVTDGLVYNGTLVVGEMKFSYDLTFGVPIPQLNDNSPPENPEEAKALSKKLFQVTLKNGDQTIQIDDYLFGFLLAFVVQFAVDFYYNQQTRDSNKGMLGDLVRGKHPILSRGGVAMSIGMETQYDIPADKIPPQLLQVVPA